MKTTRLVSNSHCNSYSNNNSSSRSSSNGIGLLATLIVLLMALTMTENRGYYVHAMIITANNNETEIEAATIEGSLFEVPLQMDDDDMLLEYGRFMLSHMNRSIDPCENFYEYACGNWKQAALVPSQARNDTFLHSIQMSINKLMTSFLGNASNTDAADMLEKENSAETKAKRFYKSCMQQNKEMNRGYKDLLQLEPLQRKLEPKMNETFDWININFLMPYGLYPLLSLKVHYSTDTRRLELSLGVPAKVLGSIDAKSITNMTYDLGIDDENKKKQFSDEFDQMVNFEKNLTLHATSRNETEQLTLGEFLKAHQTDKLNWTRFFDVAFNGSVHSEWILHNSFDRADKFEKFMNRTNLTVLRDYVKWRHLVKFYYLWKSDFGNKSLENTCREHTEQYFNYALLPWFIEQTYDADRRADILQVSKLIKEQFYELIDKYTWLDDDTKSGARSKLNAMDLTVGYSDEMRHKGVINLVYNDLNISSNDWFGNLFAVEWNRARVRMRSVHKTIIPPLMSTRSVNAYYADFLNLVFVTVGIAQMPFYHIHFPPVLKFGGIGNIVGHEMAHGFDSYCYQFNYDGKKQNWWSVDSLRNFRERYQCLESQYNKMIYHGVATNGTLTSGDNIADNVGTRIAYYAYMKAYGQQDSNHKPIPGLDFNSKQLYFLQFAQTWCSGKDDAYKLRRMRSDAHAYEEFRVVGTLSNMPEFSEVFQCKLGSNMNPLKKCVVW